MFGFRTRKPTLRAQLRQRRVLKRAMSEAQSYVDGQIKWLGTEQAMSHLGLLISAVREITKCKLSATEAKRLVLDRITEADYPYVWEGNIGRLKEEQARAKWARIERERQLYQDRSVKMAA